MAMRDAERRAGEQDKRLCGISIAVVGDVGGRGASGWRETTEAARIAELCGFNSVWLTRGSTGLGEVQPNPALTAAAVAVTTRSIKVRVEVTEQLRDNSLRAAEDWSVVDNLSNARVELLSAAEHRKEMEPISRDLRDLWNGNQVRRAGPGKEEYTVHTFPAPQQADPMFWLTDSGDGAELQLAGSAGTGVFVRKELAFDQMVERVGALQEQYQAATRNLGRVAVTVNTTTGQEEIQQLRALGVEEVVYEIDLDSTRGHLTEALTELAHANHLLQRSDGLRA
ncbi:hypothetical protein B1H18_08870 [Streptomyces tsukubensis]|uniref:Luciferase-like domain-containing protein n=2 Tax=Streptomyces tsukubensis TaxID=83656 RepID=A0A1V4AC02_9ACTN|nr:hypothetical protein B1H18_08870 [Streptomyces tsukubensis]